MAVRPLSLWRKSKLKAEPKVGRCVFVAGVIELINFTEDVPGGLYEAVSHGEVLVEALTGC